MWVRSHSSQQLFEVFNLGSDLLQLIGDLVVGDRTVRDVIGQEFNHLLNAIHLAVEGGRNLRHLGLGCGLGSHVYLFSDV